MVKLFRGLIDGFVFFTFFTFVRMLVYPRPDATLFCPFSMIFSANDSVFRAEHAQRIRTSSFLSKSREIRYAAEGARKSEKSGKQGGAVQTT